MKRDPGRISIFTFDPWENLIQNIITPKEFHTEIGLSLRNSKAKNISPYSSRIASWSLE
jgi:hypothetical protein